MKQIQNKVLVTKFNIEPVPTYLDWLSLYLGQKFSRVPDGAGCSVVDPDPEF